MNMMQKLHHSKRLLVHVAMALVLGLALAAPRVRAEPVPKEQDKLVAQVVCQLLHEGHLNRPEINEELSRRLFRKFLKDLDPGKLYFVKSDYEEFKKHETELADQLQQGDMRFAYIVYNRLLARMKERQKLIDELVKAPHDFTAKEYLETDYDTIPFTDNEKDLNERWRKRIKFD